ncbi:hypothetical protein AB1Y20_014829 [Prymnesium parvum]|uniref:Uncharacterized protein n=1 Tax=Prymnesium parvum TaxID=97485 RepID=A0AB34JWN0_PRYPA
MAGWGRSAAVRQGATAELYEGHPASHWHSLLMETGHFHSSDLDGLSAAHLYAIRAAMLRATAGVSREISSLRAKASAHEDELQLARSAAQLRALELDAASREAEARRGASDHEAEVIRSSALLLLLLLVLLQHHSEQQLHHVHHRHLLLLHPHRHPVLPSPNTPLSPLPPPLLPRTALLSRSPPPPNLVLVLHHRHRAHLVLPVLQVLRIELCRSREEARSLREVRSLWAEATREQFDLREQLDEGRYLSEESLRRVREELSRLLARLETEVRHAVTQFRAEVRATRVDGDEARALLALHALRRSERAAEEHRAKLQASHDRLAAAARASDAAREAAEAREGAQAARLVALRRQAARADERMRAECEGALREAREGAAAESAAAAEMVRREEAAAAALAEAWEGAERERRAARREVARLRRQAARWRRRAVGAARGGGGGAADELLRADRTDEGWGEEGEGWEEEEEGRGGARSEASRETRDSPRSRSSTSDDSFYSSIWRRPSPRAAHPAQHRSARPAAAAQRSAPCTRVEPTAAACARPASSSDLRPASPDLRPASPDLRPASPDLRPASQSSALRPTSSSALRPTSSSSALRPAATTAALRPAASSAALRPSSAAPPARATASPAAFRPAAMPRPASAISCYQSHRPSACTHIPSHAGFKWPRKPSVQQIHGVSPQRFFVPPAAMPRVLAHDGSAVWYARPPSRPLSAKPRLAS